MKAPERWDSVLLQRVAEVRSGLSKSSNRQGKALKKPYLRVANVQDGFVDLSEIKEIEVPINQIDRFTLRSGDLLLIEGNGNPENLGRGCIWAGQIPDCVHQNHIFAVRTLKNADLLPEFLMLQLQSRKGRNYLLSCAKSSTGLATLNSQQLKQFPVLLPPLPEQRKIAEILRTWNEATENLEALRAANEGRYRALARRFLEPCHPAFHGRPNAWREFELGEVFRERSQSGEENDRLLSITMHGGVIDRDEVGRKDTSTEDKSKYKLILPGDIGYNTMRMWQGVSGLSALRGIISPAYTVVTPVPNRIVGRYAAHLFKSRRMVFDFERYSQGLTCDTWNLKFPAFSKIKVFLPPIEDQEKQADLLDTLTSEGSVIGKQLEALTRQKRGLMQKLLTGEWRVQVERSGA